MSNKYISKTLVYSFVAAFMLSSIMLIDNNRAFAFFGFNLFGTGDEEQTSPSTTSQSSLSLQNAQCHSPKGSIVDSCNSGDSSETEDTGYNTFGH